MTQIRLAFSTNVRALARHVTHVIEKESLSVKSWSMPNRKLISYFKVKLKAGKIFESHAGDKPACAG